MWSMSDTPTSPEQATEDTPLSAVFVAFHYKGIDNGVPKEGFDSKVLQAPADVRITSADDLQAVANAIAETTFVEGRKYVGLEITVINVFRLPV